MLSHEIKLAVFTAYKAPLKLQSDYARSNSLAVAAAASMGYISSQESLCVYANKWRVTADGIDMLTEAGWL